MTRRRVLDEAQRRRPQVAVRWPNAVEVAVELGRAPRGPRASAASAAGTSAARVVARTSATAWASAARARLRRQRSQPTSNGPRRRALQEPVGVERPAAEQVAVEVGELADRDVRREARSRSGSPTAAPGAPSSLEHVDEADGRAGRAGVERLHRGEALEDLGQPLLLPRVLEPRDRRLQRGLVRRARSASSASGTSSGTNAV